MRRHTVPLIGLLVIGAMCSTASADPAWPELFRKAIAAPSGQTAKYSYEQVTVDGAGNELYRLAYDPLKPDGARFTLLSFQPSFADHAKQVLARHEAEGDDIWCDDMEKSVKGDVALAADNGDTVTFTFQPTDPDADGPQKKVIEKSDATLVVDKESARVRSVQYNLAEPYKPVIVAKVHQFSFFGQCTPTSQGRSYMSDSAINLNLTLLGKDQMQKNRTLVQNLKLVGQ